MDEIKKTYTEAQKKATKKYRENNRDKVNEQRKKYYQNRKTKDPQFLEYKRQKAKEYYQKKKASKKPKIEDKLEVKAELIIPDELKEPVEEIKDAPVKIVNKETIEHLIVDLVIDHPVIDETIQEKKKRKYIRKNKSI